MRDSGWRWALFWAWASVRPNPRSSTIRSRCRLPIAIGLLAPVEYGHHAGLSIVEFDHHPHTRGCLFDHGAVLCDGHTCAMVVDREGQTQITNRVLNDRLKPVRIKDGQVTFPSCPRHPQRKQAKTTLNVGVVKAITAIFRQMGCFLCHWGRAALTGCTEDAEHQPCHACVRQQSKQDHDTVPRQHSQGQDRHAYSSNGGGEGDKFQERHH